MPLFGRGIVINPGTTDETAAATGAAAVRTAEGGATGSAQGDFTAHADTPAAAATASSEGAGAGATIAGAANFFGLPSSTRFGTINPDDEPAVESGPEMFLRIVGAPASPPAGVGAMRDLDRFGVGAMALI
mmetsp:Transcript_9402/g.21820  ORF Transcript_9402/g.21820 Transcript_9402/m.21820 type:complete len:131 (-) Transcript_9402:567-959(-)